MAPIKNSNSNKSYNKSPQDLQTLKLFLVLFFLTIVLFAGVQVFNSFQVSKARQPSTAETQQPSSFSAESK
jgi:hypothetical protein